MDNITTTQLPDQGPPPEENLAQTQQFLQALNPDPKAAFTFQTFDDTDVKRPNTVVRNGMFMDIVALLVNLNRQKYGCFVTVNKTDGTGRKSKNIIELHAVFIDQDDKIGPLSKPFALPPSATVKSGGGYHYYWLLKDGEELGRFTSTQVALANYYGTDTTVSDLPRIMRLPGFFHNKGERKRVELIESDPTRRYTIDEILGAHGIEPIALKAAPVAGAPREFPPADSAKIVAGCSWFAHCREDAAELPEQEWFALNSVLSKCKNGEALAHEFSAPHPDYDETETQEKYERASEYGPTLCETVEGKFGWKGCDTCPHRGRIKSPIVLGSKPNVTLLDEAAAEPIIQAALAALAAEKPNAKILFARTTLDAVAALSEERRSEFMIDFKTALSANRALGKVVSIQEFKTQIKQAQARRAEHQENAARRAAAESGLPLIEVEERQLREVSDDAMTVLINSNQPPKTFVQAGHLVFVKPAEGGKLEIHRHNQATMKRLLSRIANFDHITFEGLYAPPEAVVRDILTNIELNGIAKINGISTVPIIRPDGSIFSTEGFDPQTGIYYLPPPGFELPEIPEIPTDEDLAAAVRIFYEPFRQFPYTGRSDWAHVVAYHLTLLLRFLIRGNLPGFAFSANRQAVGKTLHCELGSIIVFGFDSAEPIPPSGDDDEVRKKITSELLKGSPHAVIDNVMGLLNSPALAAVLTSRMWADRKLGVSESPRLPNNTVWAFTGNNMRFGDDLVRRIIRINMFYAKENPEEARPPFDIPDLTAFAKENRPQLLASLLTMVRAWFARGCPEAPGQKPLGSYVEWSGIIGGILHVAGIPGFLENTLESKGQNDGDCQQWSRLFQAAFSIYFDTAFEISSIVEMIREGQNGIDRKGLALHEALPEFILKKLTGSMTNLSPMLGNALRRIDGTIHGGISIEKCGKNPTTNTVRWRLRVHDDRQLPENARNTFRLLSHLRRLEVCCEQVSSTSHLSTQLYDFNSAKRIAAFKPFPTQPSPSDHEAVDQWLSLMLLEPKVASETCRRICGDAFQNDESMNHPVKAGETTERS